MATGDHVSEVGLILLGDSWSEKSSVGNLILKKTEFNPREEPKSSTIVQQEIQEKELIIINTPDLLQSGMTEEELKAEIDTYLRLCASIPHLFLLVVQTETFTEEQKKKFYKLYELFGDRLFVSTLVLISTSMQKNPSLNQNLKDMIKRCGNNSFILKDDYRKELLKKIDNILKKIKEEQQSFKYSEICQQREVSSAAGASSLGGLLRRRESYQFLPPHMSEAWLILLGESWSENSLVGNIILGKTVFKSMENPNSSIRVKKKIQKTNLVVINTPDLLHPQTPEEKLKVEVDSYLRLCASIPHLLLLVVQPENFTEEQKERFYKVSKLFGHQSFDRTLVLISTSTQKIPSANEDLNDVVKRCGDNSLILEENDHDTLLRKIGNSLEKRKDTCIDFQYPGIKQQREVFSASGAARGAGRGLRIMLFGATLSTKKHLCNFILKKTSSDISPTSHQAKIVEQGLWKGKILTIVTPPESQTGKVQKGDLRSCVNLCPPGPNVLLLLVNPSDFTEKDRQALKATLNFFGIDAFKQSMVIMTEEGNETSFAFNSLIKECEGRHYSLTENNHQKLVEKIEDIVKRNSSAFLSIKDDEASKCDQSLTSLNLVLCGRRGAAKTSAAKAILGLTELPSAFSSSECVRNQGEVCGRWVSLVDLPALYGKPQQERMKESFRCITLCNPEGVHTFILVLPVGPLTDEEEGELQTIQDTFSSRVNNNTMILFTTDSDPEHPDVVKCLKNDKNIKELIKRCGKRYIVVKSSDKKQFSKVIDFVGEGEHSCYTIETLFEAYLDKILRQEENFSGLQTKSPMLPSQSGCSGDKDKWTYECLRIVLIGKTGCGKSSSGNTILGREEFKANISLNSVTRCSKKSLGEVEGRPVAVVDTPGLFHDSLTKEEVELELVKCLNLLAPGPHVFLVVVPIGGRITPEERETLKVIKEVFGQNSEKYTIILFTRGDLLKGKQSIEEYVEKSCDDAFKKFIGNCAGYHMFDNNDTQNRRQVIELIRKIDTLVAKNGCFTNEMLQEAETAIQNQIQLILKEKEEEIEQEKKKLEERHQKQMEEMERNEKTQKEKELKEKEEKIKEIEKKLQQSEEEKKKEQEQRKKEEAKWKQEREALMGNRPKGQFKTPEALEKEKETLRQKWDKVDKKWKMEKDKLEHDYEKEKEDYTKMMEEERMRKEKEAIYKQQMQDVFRQDLQKLTEKYEEEARQKAEEINEFKEKYLKEFTAMMLQKDEKYNMLKALKDMKENKHRKEITDVVKCVTRKRENVKKLKDMLSKQEEEMKKAKSQQEMTQRGEEHNKELSDLIQQLMGETDVKTSCFIS